jgi:formylglycine-generating enzyme required for sulfatase activity
VSQSKVSEDSYADLNTQRALDKIDEKYSAQLGQAAEYYSRVFDYDPTNAEARAKLASVYMDMWRSALRRNKPELIAAYAKEVSRYAGPESYKAYFKSEIDGDGKLRLSASGVKAEVFIYRYVETGKWNRLTPAPYRLSERRVEDSALDESASKLRLAADGRNGESLYFLSFDEHYGHHPGQTPLSLDQMPAGSYLFLLRASGYEDLRVPVTIASQKDLDLNVRMLKTGERPFDFCYVPYVWAKVGGPAAGTKWPNYTWKSVTPFFIQTYEVTFGEYESFLKDLIAEGKTAEAQQHLPKDFGFSYFEIVGGQIKAHEKLTEGWRNWPVRGVSWLDAQAFAAWRTRKEGVAYRLPTDLEWEVAARGTDGRRYTWGENLWPQAARLTQGYGGLSNLEAASLRRTGQFADESVFGVWDMTGSQAEWCADDFSGREGERVLRGNAWALQPMGLETAFRTSGPPDYFHSTTGFRLARDLQ